MHEAVDRAAPDACPHAEGEGGDRRHEGDAEHEAEGHGEPSRDGVGDVLARVPGGAEVTAQGVGEPVAVLGEDGAVEAEGGVLGVDGVLGGALAEELAAESSPDETKM
ncbi:predicted protein [Streptomyces sp. SPB78]|nr:predicted protein [Streptomyces sp. SPB78]